MALAREVVEQFIGLVTDGKAINAIDVCPTCGAGNPGPIGNERKEKFLLLGKALLWQLSLELGIFGTNPNGRPWISKNEAGVASSGDIYLTHPRVCITFSHRLPRTPTGDFWAGPPNQWRYRVGFAWEELRDMRACAIKIEELLAQYTAEVLLADNESTPELDDEDEEIDEPEESSENDEASA